MNQSTTKRPYGKPTLEITVFEPEESITSSGATIIDIDGLPG